MQVYIFLKWHIWVFSELLEAIGSQCRESCQLSIRENEHHPEREIRGLCPIGMFLKTHSFPHSVPAADPYLSWRQCVPSPSLETDPCLLKASGWNGFYVAGTSQRPCLYMVPKAVGKLKSWFDMKNLICFWINFICEFKCQFFFVMEIKRRNKIFEKGKRLINVSFIF